MEIKLTKAGWGSTFRGGGQSLCAASLHRKIDLPIGTKVIYAVFTKTSPNEDAFTIGRPISQVWGGPRSGIEGYRGTLSYDTRIVLARKYKLGYRYVNFDYEVAE